MVDSLLLRGHPGERLPPHPKGSEEFAGTHDAAITRVFKMLLDIRGDQDTFHLASLPCRLGGVSNWADSLHMIRKRHPDVADFITVAGDF